MAKKFEDKFKEIHEIKNRIIIWYVRAYLKERSLNEKYEKAKSELNNWENQLSPTDKYLADLIINGATVDRLNAFQKDIFMKETGINPTFFSILRDKGE